jgi:hypothetical protein
MLCYYDETVVETVTTIGSPTIHIARDTQPRFRR